MKVVQIQFNPWDKIYHFNPNNLKLELGDNVVVKTEIGTEMGKVVGFIDADEGQYREEKETPLDLKDGESQSREEDIKKDEVNNKDKMIIKPVLRKATVIDSEKRVNPADKKKALTYCQKAKDKYRLPMKFIDVHFSFDGSRITFAFIADGRIDFRELVKDLTRHFGRTIRLQQIGIRDEAKIMGDYGHCGRILCCRRFLPELTSITSEMAELQQCSHRGSERISGICGRLMCCLAYEEEGYEGLMKNLAPIGTKVNIEGKKGVIVGHHVLKQTIDVEFAGENGEEGTTVEIDLKKGKRSE
jgi:cell fate regulator YaaT (PSP1 superfamily)